MLKRFLFVLLLLSLLPASAQGQGPVGQDGRSLHLIRLKSATFDPLVDGEPGRPNAGRASADEVEGPYYIVQFKGPIEKVWAEQVEQLGAQLLGYLPDNAYMARIQPADVQKVSSLDAVRWLGPYRPAYKVSPAITLRQGPTDGRVIDAYVVAFPGESKTALQQFLSERGAAVGEATETGLGTIFHAALPLAALSAISQHPGVSWIEPYVPLYLDNSAARKIMNVESVWQNNGYFGAGQIIAISDSGLSVQGALNPDFAGRLKRAFAPSEMNLASAQCAAKTNWTDLNGHGTHVAGSVLGSGTNSGSNAVSHQYATSFAGNAPEAQLVFMAMNTDGSSGIQCISGNGSFIAKGYEEGARISSNSWGGNVNGTYDLRASIVDDYVWRHQDYLVHYSAGNAGPDPGTIGSPGVAKNILTVGASENYRPNFGASSDNPNVMADFSSRGPTADGRVKPDVVAPGTYVLSVRAEQGSITYRAIYDNNYAFLSGTSMATPLTAGASALVREWLGKERGLTNPSAALLKALMIHGAAQLPGTATPNMDSGWGRVDLKNTLNAQYAIFDDHLQGLTTGQVVSYTVHVVAATDQVLMFATDAQPTELAAPDVFSLSAASSQLDATPVVSSAVGISVEAVPGFKAPQGSVTIQSGNKDGLAPRQGLTPPSPSSTSNHATLTPLDDASINSFLMGMVGGGDFEDPDWTNYWSKVWLGYGVPLRTNGLDGGVVLDGFYSVWLGGTPSNDSIWYPLSFPDTIASDSNSYLQFKLQMRNLDPGRDYFCVAFADVSGFVIGGLQDCYTNELTAGQTFQYTAVLTPSQKSQLQGQTGYLVLYTRGNGQTPHMSTFVDDVVLSIDFANPTLSSTPTTAPAGTTFLLTGKNNTPYGFVDVCLSPCSTTGNYLGTVYADGKGNVAAYLRTSTTATPGTYALQTRDYYNRTANISITISGASNPTLGVTPTSGQAGTRFSFSGSNFLPNDSRIQVSVNNTSIGTVGSSSSGVITFSVASTSNTPAGMYSVRATDTASRSASTSFQVTAVPSGTAMLVISPTAGTAGTTFTLIGSNWTPAQNVSFTLDGQTLGMSSADASGRFNVKMTTLGNMAPGSYTVEAIQGAKRASAQFQISSAPGPAPSGKGIYVTLVWSDPPAQANAATALVNNLNLRVVGPAGTFYGNGGSSPDTRNNVETVRLENPTAGTYTIYVEAQSVNGTFGSQPYALVATTAQNFGTNTSSVGLPSNSLYLPLTVR